MIYTIYPFKHRGAWVFNDPTRNIALEPFVHGSDKIIDVMTKDIPGANNGFALWFSDASFDWSNLCLTRRESETFAGLAGTWYHARGLYRNGWLCPALLSYFPEPPATIYAAFLPLDHKGIRLDIKDHA